MVKLMSKWNGRNYYGFVQWKSRPVEVVKEGGRFYVAKYTIKHGLTATGNPLKNFTFIS